MYFYSRHGNTVLSRRKKTMAETKDETSGQSAVASYVATMSSDLAGMARRNGLDTLGYLLEMARLEAESQIRHNGSNGRRP